MSLGDPGLFPDLSGIDVGDRSRVAWFLSSRSFGGGWRPDQAAQLRDFAIRVLDQDYAREDMGIFVMCVRALGRYSSTLSDADLLESLEEDFVAAVRANPELNERQKEVFLEGGDLPRAIERIRLRCGVGVTESALSTDSSPEMQRPALSED